jgi:uncharacterized membrane protein
MTKKQRKKKTPAKAAPQRAEAGGRATSRIAHPRLLLTLALLGVALTAYLTLSKWLSTPLPYCGVESSCDLVQSSRWSMLFGMPLSVWGLLSYATLACLVWRARRRVGAWTGAFYLSGVCTGISLYLSAVSWFEIEALCVYCTASTVLMTLLFVVVCSQKPSNLQKFKWRVGLPIAALWAVLVVTGLHLHFSGLFDAGAGPEKPYLKALSIHLTESGGKFYGAYWCPRCQNQKELFEASAARLPYVECSPGGRNGPRNLACVNRDIREFPTWIIGSRRYVGALSPDNLARYSGFVWKPTTSN